MVQLKGKARLVNSEEPKDGQSYIITATEETKTAVQAFVAIRVTLTPTGAKEKKRLKEADTDCVSMLWMRDEAGERSKLGAFLSAFTSFLGDEDEALDTDNWIKHEIRIISWKPKAREIVVIQ
ncbi:hypothetical protein ES703_98915 [subsurface metagenome]